jgi:hypothetical protein
VIVRAPRMFLDTVLRPEFQKISAAFPKYLAEVTDRAFREAVYKEAGGAEEIPQLARIGR